MYVIDQVCRVCLKTIMAPDLIHLDDKIPENSTKTYQHILSELIAADTHQQSKGFELPQQLCEACAQEVVNCYRLRRKLQSSEKILVNQIQRQQQLQEMDTTLDIESLDSSIVVIDNVVKVKTTDCGLRCSECTESSCAVRMNNDVTVDSCNFCGANKSSCNICSVDESEISVLDSIIEPAELQTETFRCEDCLKEFATKSRLRKHVLTHSPSKPFHCRNCKWSFATESELTTHSLVNHAAEGKNECVYCFKTFKEKRLLRQHMITHKQFKRFSCRFCEKAFNLLHHLKNHEKIHENKSEYECDQCKKRFITKDRLSSHLKTHKEKSYRCTICGKAFVSEVALKTHEETHQNDEGTLICSGCGLQFVESAKFNRHRKYQCPSGTVKMGLNEGLKVLCLVCSLEFSSESAMKEHMKTKHTNQFVCPTCSRSFLKESNLKTHLKTHTVRAFVCQFCQESFNRSDHLKNHITRKHPEESDNDFRHTCNVCSKKFVQSGELNIHMRIHTQTKPYKCETCHKSFAQANQLKNHERLHSNDRPYSCNVCYQSYASASGLQQHLSSTHTSVIKEEAETLYAIQSPSMSGILSSEAEFF